MKKLLEMLDSTGIPYAFVEFPTESDTYSPPSPPFICYLIGSSNNIKADNSNWVNVHQISLELYTDHKDADIEKKVTDALNAFGFIYESEETKLDKDRLYEVIYSFEKEIKNE